MNFSVTKTFTFDAAHYLENYEGVCATMHGHTYKLEVTAGCTHLDAQDMVIDFAELKQLVEAHVLSKFDHRVINEVVDYNPTAERMAADILQTLIAAGINVTRVKLWETPTSYVEVKP